MQSQTSELAKSAELYHAFLSFTSNDKQAANEIRRQLNSTHANLMLLDHAVLDRYDKNWKLECAEKIDKAEVLICLVGTTTYQSEAVAWEIGHGLDRGKRVLACNIARHPVQPPDVLVQHAIKLTPTELLGVQLATLVENRLADTIGV